MHSRYECTYDPYITLGIEVKWGLWISRRKGGRKLGHLRVRWELNPQPILPKRIALPMSYDEILSITSSILFYVEERKSKRNGIFETYLVYGAARAAI
jgi:hypothetical protein